MCCSCSCSLHTKKKPDGESVKCVNLRVSEESQAYKLYEPVEEKFIINRDVVLNESRSWDYNKGKHASLEETHAHVNGDCEVDP